MSDNQRAATHLVVFQHGLLGSEADFANVLALFQRHLAPDHVVAHVATANATAFTNMFATCDGIDHGAERLATEIVRVAGAIPGLARFSIVGHSMGGLYARYCIGILYARGFFDHIEPVNFVTLASPHLGNRRPQRGGVNLIYNAIAPRLFDRTGKQFALQDEASEQTIALSKCVENKYPHRTTYEAFQEIDGELTVSLQGAEFAKLHCELRNRVLSFFPHSDDSPEVQDAGPQTQVELTRAEVMVVVPEKASSSTASLDWDIIIRFSGDAKPICTLCIPHADLPTLWRWIPALANASANVRCCSPSTRSLAATPPSANSLLSCLTRGQFMQALQLFRVRTLYATVFNDHTVPYSCAAVRAFNPYRLESEAALVTNPYYDHIVQRTFEQAPVLRDTLRLDAKLQATRKSTDNNLVTKQQKEEEEEEDVSTGENASVPRSPAFSDGRVVLDRVEDAFSTDEARDTLRGMLLAVQSVGWRRLDVNLDSLLAHEMIIAKRADIENATTTDWGLDVVHHLIDTFEV